MKIRTGFVSNSSTSSFLIYGVAMKASEIPKGESTPGEEEDDNAYEICEELASKHKLQHHKTPYDEIHFIGLSWDDVKDDETGAQFKARVESLIEKALGKKLPCCTHQEAWED